MSGVVVVGGGQAGASVVIKLRKLGFDEKITLIGDEKILPYQRPPLSKGYLLGDISLERLFFRPQSYYEENNINLIDIRKRNQITSEKLFEKAAEQFYQGQLSRNDFRLAQIDLSTSKNRLNQTLYNAKIAELNLYRLSGKIIEETSK